MALNTECFYEFGPYRRSNRDPVADIHKFDKGLHKNDRGQHPAKPR